MTARPGRVRHGVGAETAIFRNVLPVRWQAAGNLDEADAFRIVADALTGVRSEQLGGLAGVHRRVADALLEGGSEDDVASLARQLLVRERLRRGGADVHLDVAKARVSASAWRRHGCSEVPIGDQRRVRVEPWRPDWLSSSQTAPGELAAAAGLPIALRRQGQTVPADPFFVDALGEHFSDYQSWGQRQATRAAALLAPGATLVVSLNTGSGKTEAVLAPILHAAKRQGATSVLVVPTLSLAQDLDRRIRGILGLRTESLAYTGDTSRDRLADLRRLVASAEVPVIITSPESALGSLREPLTTVARTGRLAYLVVDEAHLIAAWGTDFRPEFGALASLRRELLAAAPTGDTRVRTALLSATFSDADLRLFHQTYGEPIDVVASNALRSEPDYWVTHATSEESRVDLVLQAVAHLPKPLFLYTAWVDDAEEWARRLRERYARVGRITGAVPGEERRSVLDGLRGDGGSTRYDIVVATSAFGLGVSFDEVRSVVHACVPESVDRYYQEVGRGGRDGHASVGLMVWTESDLAKASPLARTVVIGWEKAKNRWEAMAASLEGDERSLDVSAPPVHAPGRSDLNESWNLATLALMHRAGLVEHRSSAADPVDDRGGRRWRKRAQVHVRRGDLARDEVWKAAWSELERQVRSENADRLRFMTELLAPGARVCERLAAAYRVTEASPLGSNALGIQPVLACGLCDACDHGPLIPSVPSEPAPPGAEIVHPAARRQHQETTGWPQVVLCPTPRTHRDVRDVQQRFLERCVDDGVLVFAVPTDLATNHRFQQLQSRTEWPLLVADVESDVPWSLPPVRVAVVTDLARSPVPGQWFAGGPDADLVILAGDLAPSPERRDRTMSELPAPNTCRLSEFLDR